MHWNDITSRLARDRTAQLFTGLAAACLLAALGWSQWKSRDEVSLYEGRRFRAGELTELQNAFAQANLDDWRCEDGRVLVPRRKRLDYLKAVESADAFPTGLAAGWDGQYSPTLLDSRQLREEKQRHALQAELSRVVRAMAGIEEAAVKYSELIERGLHPRVLRRAMVAARGENGEPLTGQQVQAIRETVVASIAGLSDDQVTITDLNHAMTWTGGVGAVRERPRQVGSPAESLPGASDDRVAAEDQLRERIAQQLEQWAGAPVEVSFRTPTTIASRYRPAVSVQGSTHRVVELRAPASALAKHFGGPEILPSQLPQIAAERLQPIVQQLTRQPTAVSVTAVPDEADILQKPAGPSALEPSQSPSDATDDRQASVPIAPSHRPLEGQETATAIAAGLLALSGLALYVKKRSLRRTGTRRGELDATCEPQWTAETGESGVGQGVEPVVSSPQDASDLAGSILRQPEALAALLQRWIEDEAGATDARSASVS
ncbi:MAG: hypothetical protein KDB14_18265 [Planctomycetales bacterium]|nr:hypothetical protein [Planctomycetales bacterium]